MDQGSKGIIIAKGQPNAKRFTYIQAASVLKTIEDVEAVHGKFSFGVCQTCKKYSSTAYSNRTFGLCNIDKKEHGCFDTCDKHSKDGGGFGV